MLQCYNTQRACVREILCTQRLLVWTYSPQKASLEKRDDRQFHGLGRRKRCIRRQSLRRAWPAMTAQYPTGIDVKTLHADAIALKIARHSRCSECEKCTGLRPPLGTALVLDSDQQDKQSLGALAQYDSDEDEGDSKYLKYCACGHGTEKHGADEARLGKDEYTRRAKVAIRLDELLSVILFSR